MNNIDPIKISVIIVVLNGKKTIRRAIESVLCQTYEHIDLIVIDGGSTDGTISILNEYSPSFKFYVSRKDAGIYFAMNEALIVCDSDWHIFLGCDDVLLDCFHLCVKKMVDVSSIYYGDIIRRSNGAIYDGKFNKLKLTFRNICHQAIFYPRCTTDLIYDAKYKYLADYKKNIQLIGSGLNFVYLPYVISNYNDNGSASIGDMVFSRDKSEILKENLGALYSLAWNLREFFANIYRYFKYKKYNSN